MSEYQHDYQQQYHNGGNQPQDFEDISSASSTSGNPHDPYMNNIRPPDIGPSVDDGVEINVIRRTRGGSPGLNSSQTRGGSPGLNSSQTTSSMGSPHPGLPKPNSQLSLPPPIPGLLAMGGLAAAMTNQQNGGQAFGHTGVGQRAHQHQLVHNSSSLTGSDADTGGAEVDSNGSHFHGNGSAFLNGSGNLGTSQTNPMALSANFGFNAQEQYFDPHPGQQQPSANQQSTQPQLIPQQGPQYQPPQQQQQHPRQQQQQPQQHQQQQFQKPQVQQYSAFSTEQDPQMQQADPQPQQQQQFTEAVHQMAVQQQQQQGMWVGQQQQPQQQRAQTQYQQPQLTLPFQQPPVRPQQQQQQAYAAVPQQQQPQQVYQQQAVHSPFTQQSTQFQPPQQQQQQHQSQQAFQQPPFQQAVTTMQIVQSQAPQTVQAPQAQFSQTLPPPPPPPPPPEGQFQGQRGGRGGRGHGRGRGGPAINPAVHAQAGKPSMDYASLAASGNLRGVIAGLRVEPTDERVKAGMDCLSEALKHQLLDLLGAEGQALLTDLLLTERGNIFYQLVVSHPDHPKTVELLSMISNEMFDDLSLKQGAALSITRLYQVSPQWWKRQINMRAVTKLDSLATHPYGNYIASCMMNYLSQTGSSATTVPQGSEAEEERVLMQLLVHHMTTPKFIVAACCDKFGSHVIEAWAGKAPPEHLVIVLNSILDQEPDTKTANSVGGMQGRGVFGTVADHSIGNYPLQRVMKRVHAEAQAERKAVVVNMGAPKVAVLLLDRLRREVGSLMEGSQYGHHVLRALQPGQQQGSGSANHGHHGQGGGGQRQQHGGHQPRYQQQQQQPQIIQQQAQYNPQQGNVIPQQTQQFQQAPPQQQQQQHFPNPGGGFYQQQQQQHQGYGMQK